MTRLTLRIGIAVSVGVSCLLAATPAGTITSAGDFDLSGTRVAVAAVPAHRVVAGDQIITHNSPAYLTMRDGSKFTLLPNSTMRIERNGSRLRVRLVKGDFKYTLSNKSRTEVASFATLPANFSSANAVAGSKNAITQPAPDLAPVLPIAPPRAPQGNISPSTFAPGLTLGRPPISPTRP
ncbi:MAG: hypothetical protein M3Y07_01420 [Acidobacteriota bacterium]|nr:hypothetical protein [Acidobacteriota bacterium]